MLEYAEISWAVASWQTAVLHNTLGEDAEQQLKMASETLSRVGGRPLALLHQAEHLKAMKRV